METPNGHGGHLYRAAGTAGWGYPVERTALLVIDPVNDFLSEGGAGWDLVEGTVTKHDVVGHLRQAIDVTRRHTIPVLYAPMAFVRADYTDQQLQRRTGINRLMFERRMFLAGTWGADFHPELQPADDEIILEPHKLDDVFETDLPDHLERLGTVHLVIAGMAASLCCEATGRHASEHGYDVTFLRDAIGATNLAAYEASIRLSYPLVGNAVLDVAEFAAVVAAGAEATPQVGDEVMASDQFKLGTIADVVTGDGGVDHLVVPRSIFSSDVYLPLDAVTKVAPGKVFVNVPKLLIGKMPWSERPSPAAQRHKSGPPRETVTALYGSRSPSTFPS